MKLSIAVENVCPDVSLALKDSSLLKHSYQKACQRVCLLLSTYHNTKVIEKLAANEVVRVVVLIGREQFTQDSADVIKCSQVIGET